MPEDAATKVCPLCAESIKAAAKICPHCRKAQNRWLLFLSRFDLYALVTVAVFIGTACWIVSFLGSGRNFSQYRGQFEVLNSKFSIETTSEETNVVIDGVLTNGSNFTWEVGSFEVRYFGNDGKIADVNRVNGYFEVQPHSEHSFHLVDFDAQSIPNYPSYHLIVTSAEDPNKW